jgi:hypothetical protein
MNAEVKANLVAALRSDKYQQGRGCLRQVDGPYSKFCCLGVLSDIVDPHGWADHPNSVGVIPHHEDYTGMPSEEVLLQAGLGQAE